MGPIGSGKSTILDAISFALYGQTPRGGRNAISLIHQQAEDGAVALLFEAEGAIWEAVRNLRRAGTPQHVLYEREGQDAGGRPRETITGTRAMRDRVEALLGVDFAGFGRSVLLAQGRFAEFLSSRPAERDRVLKGLFGFDRLDKVRELARDRENEAHHLIEKLDIKARHAEQAETQLEGYLRQSAVLQARLEALRGIRPRYEELERVEREAGRTIEEAMARLTALQRRSAELISVSDADEVAARCREAITQRQEAERQLERSSHALEAARELATTRKVREREALLQDAGALVRRVHDLEEMRERSLSEVVQAAEEVAQTERQRNSNLANLERLQASRQAAAVVLTEADERLTVAEQHLDTTVRADMSGTLRERLVVGESCPVCEQEVASVPSSCTVDTESARRGVLEAKRHRRNADDHLSELTQQSAGLSADLAAVNERLLRATRRHQEREADNRDLATRLDEARRELTGMLGEGDPSVLIVREKNLIDELRAQVEEAQAAVDDVQRHLNQMLRHEKESQDALGEIRTNVAVLFEFLAGEAPPLDPDPAAAMRSLRALHDAWSQETSQQQHTLNEARATAEQASAEMTSLRRQHDFGGSIEATLAELSVLVEKLASDIRRTEEDASTLESLKCTKAEQVRHRDIHRRIRHDFNNSKFIRFLLDEERVNLAELGSRHFHELSSRRYSFDVAEDGTFRAIDHTTADSVRSCDSLSGGETFLASLALALALAEMVGRSGGRLDSFFLDEGFGTLDSEHLDLAMQGVESLVSEASDRLVMVVSHVVELKERIDDLVILDRDQITGDTRIVSGAARGEHSSYSPSATER